MPRTSSRNSLAAMLAPPTIWALHFLACYLIVSLACANGAGQHAVWLGIGLASAAGLALIALIALRNGRIWRAARERHEHEEDAAPFFAVTTLLLCAISALALIWVALPAIMLPPCVA